MKRISIRILIAVAAAALLAGLVYTLLLAADVAEPAATTIHGPTVRRLWATAAAVLALLGATVGALTLRRPAGRFGGVSGRVGSVLGGIIAAVNGALVLAAAEGGPGSGNGVVGGAAAVVLGLVAAALGIVAIARARTAG